MTESSTLRLDQIRTDGGTQAREALDDGHVERLVNALDTDQTLPPLIVFYDGADYWLADGFHRRAAYEELLGTIRGDPRWAETKVRVEVRQGTRRDAVLFAVGANAEHGLPRTRADIHRAIETMLRDDEWRQWSDREIGRQVRHSHETVGAVRRRLESTGDIPPVEQRKSGDGKTRRQPTRRAAPPLEAIRDAILREDWVRADALIRDLPLLPLRGEWGKDLDRTRIVVDLLAVPDLPSALKKAQEVSDRPVREELVRRVLAKIELNPPPTAEPLDLAAPFRDALVPIRNRIREGIADQSDARALDALEAALADRAELFDPATCDALTQHISAARVEVDRLLAATTTPAVDPAQEVAHWQQRAARVGLILTDNRMVDGFFHLQEPGGLSRYPTWPGAKERIAYFERQAGAVDATEEIARAEQNRRANALVERAAAVGFNMRVGPSGAVRFVRVSDQIPFGGAKTLDDAEAQVAQWESEVGLSAPAADDDDDDDLIAQTIAATEAVLRRLSSDELLLIGRIFGDGALAEEALRGPDAAWAALMPLLHATARYAVQDDPAAMRALLDRLHGAGHARAAVVQ